MLNIYTDGACRGNPGPGGWGFIHKFSTGEEFAMFGGYAYTTNCRMELIAVIKALSFLHNSCACDITLYTDAAYVANAINKGWIDAWKANGWRKKDNKPVKKKDLWQALDLYMPRRYMKVVWVKGHAENEYNNRCDQLAVQGSRSNHLEEDTGYLDGLDGGEPLA